MDGTIHILNEGHRIRFSITHPALPVSAGPKLRGSHGAMGFSRTRAMAGIGPHAGSLCAPQPRRDGPFIGVAYSLFAHSRLGCSPKIGFNAAYHTTSCRFRSNTNLGLDKKSRGLPASRPAVPQTPACSPVSAGPSPVREAVAPRCSGISYAHGFPNPLIHEKD
jgi:hypothetical protein